MEHASAIAEGSRTSARKYTSSKSDVSVCAYRAHTGTFVIRVVREADYSAPNNVQIGEEKHKMVVTASPNEEKLSGKQNARKNEKEEEP